MIITLSVAWARILFETYVPGLRESEYRALSSAIRNGKVFKSQIQISDDRAVEALQVPVMDSRDRPLRTDPELDYEDDYEGDEPPWPRAAAPNATHGGILGLIAPWLVTTAIWG